VQALEIARRLAAYGAKRSVRPDLHTNTTASTFICFYSRTDHGDAQYYSNQSEYLIAVTDKCRFSSFRQRRLLFVCSWLHDERDDAIV
jgi:hypothetical protein